MNTLENLIRFGVARELAWGEALFTVPGTYQWTPPSHVKNVSVMVVAGGAGATYLDFNSLTLSLIQNSDTNVVGINGYGGAAAIINNFDVSPLLTYEVTVGAGGQGQVLDFRNLLLDAAVPDSNFASFNVNNNAGGLSSFGVPPINQNDDRTVWAEGGPASSLSYFVEYDIVPGFAPYFEEFILTGAITPLRANGYFSSRFDGAAWFGNKPLEVNKSANTAQGSGGARSAQWFDFIDDVNELPTGQSISALGPNGTTVSGGGGGGVGSGIADPEARTDPLDAFSGANGLVRIIWPAAKRAYPLSSSNYNNNQDEIDYLISQIGDAVGEYV